MAQKTVTITPTSHGALVMTITHRGETVLIHNASEYLAAQQRVFTDDVDVVVAVAMCLALVRDATVGGSRAVRDSLRFGGLLARVNTHTGDMHMEELA